MMRLNKAIPEEFFHPVMLIGLSTMILWFMAALGWRLALNEARNLWHYDGEVNIPSFYLTLLVLPLPYAAFRLYEYLTYKYTTVDWKSRLASSIFYGLLLSLLLQGLVLCPLFLIGSGAAAMDFIVTWKYAAVINSALWGMLIGFLTVSLTFNQKKDIRFLWWSLPAVITYVILISKLIFIAGISAKVGP